MGLLWIVGVLLVIGVAWYLIEMWIGDVINVKIKRTIYVVVCLIVVTWLVSALFGVDIFPGLAQRN